MANQAQLRILKGDNDIKFWNDWRDNHAEVKIRLTNADLSGVNLSTADLANVDLSDADLSGANLTDADLTDSNLSRSDLQNADLLRTKLLYAKLLYTNISEVDFSYANLSCADLSNAELPFSILSGANLSGVKLSRADLTKVIALKSDFSGTDLSYANLSYANFSKSNFTGAYLSQTNATETNFTGIKFYEGKLYKTKLNKAILRDVDFSFTSIIDSDFSGADITGANLFGTSKDSWIIDGIKCDYYFNDKEGKIRIPAKRNFRPGEFEELYKSMPEFILYFEEGFSFPDLAIIHFILRKLRNENPEYNLQMASIDSRGIPHITFTLDNEKYLEPAEQKLIDEYREQIKYLEGALDIAQKELDENRKHLRMNPLVFITKGGSMSSDHIEIKNTEKDVIVGKDGARITVKNITNSTAQEIYDTIANAIKESSASQEDKVDADDLNEKMAKELKKSSPDKNRLKKYWEFIVQTIPKVADHIPWEKVTEILS